MASYILRRLGQGLIVLLIVSFVSFIIFQYLGDPVLAVVGHVHISQEVREQAREKLGLNKPIYIQYFNFLSRSLKGNFGTSYTRMQPVLKIIMKRLPATFELVFTSTIIAVLLGSIIGIKAAEDPDSYLNKFTLYGSLLGISVPTFLMGIFFILLFSVTLGLLPSFGRGNTINLGFWSTGIFTTSGILHLILPALTLALYQLAMIVRLVRAEMLEVLSEDYIRTARAKGLTKTRAVYLHAFRNALIPVITIVGLKFGELIGFSIVTESVFQWPGMGKLLISAIYNNDQPVVVVYIMFVSLMILSINLFVDILYGFLDPRVRYD